MSESEEQKIIDAVMDEWVKGASIRDALSRAVRKTAKVCNEAVPDVNEAENIREKFPEAFDRVG